MDDQTKELTELGRYEKAHNEVLKQIRVLDSRMDHLAPFELAKLEYLYTRAERQAWFIAGYFKKQYKYYEGMAEVEQGLEYKEVRKAGGTGTDGQYESRVTKGNMLVNAANPEGDYVTWRGIAGTYERAANSIKDMIKAIGVEGGTPHV
jgi:hypothetical protein